MAPCSNAIMVAKLSTASRIAAGGTCGSGLIDVSRPKFELVEEVDHCLPVCCNIAVLVLVGKRTVGCSGTACII